MTGAGKCPSSFARSIGMRGGRSIGIGRATSGTEESIENMHTRERRSFGSTRGFSLVELILMVAVVAILAGIAIPIYADMHERSRVGKAPADPRAAASAGAVSGASCGHVADP
jgi:prepilin-type N-terminal cleavage/methylation domain-containing protein